MTGVQTCALPIFYLIIQGGSLFYVINNGSSTSIGSYVANDVLSITYNASTNAAVAVLNFGEDKTASSTFTVTFPTADANNAIIRIS